MECEAGVMVHLLRDNDYQAFGCDSSEDVVPYWEERESFSPGSILNLPYGKNEFDVVMTFGGFDRIDPDQYDAALQEMKRVSKGMLFLQIHPVMAKEEHEEWLERFLKNRLIVTEFNPVLFYYGMMKEE